MRPWNMLPIFLTQRRQFVHSMKLLLDNNVPKRAVSVLANFDCVIVRDVLSTDATDTAIYDWCKENSVNLFVTKDKQFAWRIASGEGTLKCVLCSFGNASVKETISIFKSHASQIDYFAKSNTRILEIE